MQCALVLIALCGADCEHALAAGAEPASAVDIHWGVRIPLRDGIELNATVYRPKPQHGPPPCVFTLTPYVSDNYHDRGMYFASGPVNSIYAQKNYNSGKLISEESVADARPVTVTLLHDSAHSSALYVPIGRWLAPAR